jgi:hypothetical protein
VSEVSETFLPHGSKSKMIPANARVAVAQQPEHERKVTKTMTTFRQIYLPYALMIMSDGCFLPVNREYKPLGQVGEMMPGVAHRAKVRIKGLTQAKAERIGLKLGGTFLYLYDDATNPQMSAANWQRYEAILERLMKMEIEHTNDSRSRGRARGISKWAHISMPRN